MGDDRENEGGGDVRTLETKMEEDVNEADIGGQEVGRGDRRLVGPRRRTLGRAGVPRASSGLPGHGL